jgi:peptidoglycan/LPS O-acetylase OafA/YrhL
VTRINTLDGLRGLAIALVLAGHVAANLQPLSAPVRRWLVVFSNPGAGVRLFFVLSGYLITGLLLRELRQTGTIGLAHFYGRRALRIFPAFYFFLIALAWWTQGGAPAITPTHWLSAGAFAWNYAFFWVPTAGVWDLGHFWTLALEQQFYLVWPLALLGLGPRRGLWLAAAVVVWCPLARLASYWLFPAQRGYLGAMAHTGLDSIMAGCAAALVFENTAVRARWAAWSARAALAAAVWLFALSPPAGELLRGFPLAAGYTLDALAAALLVVWARDAGATRLGALLGRGPLPALGLVSYSLYLWQQVFLSPHRDLAAGRWLTPLTLAIGCATASYFLVERPFLRWKKNTAAVPAPA